MKQAKRHSTKNKSKKTKDSTVHTDELSERVSVRLREGIFIVAIAVSAYLLMTLVTYSHVDPGWSQTGTAKMINNAGGRVGAFLSDLSLYLFGFCAYLFPVMFSYAAWLFFHRKLQGEITESKLHMLALRSVGFIFVIMSTAGLASLYVQPDKTYLPFTSGGILGDIIGFSLIDVFNYGGTSLILSALLLSGLTLFTGLSWLKFIDGTGAAVLMCWRGAIRAMKNISMPRFAKRKRGVDDAELAVEKVKITVRQGQGERVEPQISKAPEKSQKSVMINAPEVVKLSKRSQKDKQKTLFQSPLTGTLPPLTLLDENKSGGAQGYSRNELEDMSKQVELRLRDFGVEVKVVAVHPGPVVTRFELQLAPGTKVSKITALAKDIARSMSVISVRVVEVIQGKSVIGLELPNQHREMVRLHEILSSEQYDQARSPLSLALGKDIAGHPVVVDIAKMPHLLVAGTTGSGKSVGMNAMILSLLYKSTPEQLRMIMIDPKMLELSVYDGIPHLLTPVVTDMKDAAHALRWCVAEMERRYRLMAAMGVRNLSGFNSKIKEAKKKGEPILDPLHDPNSESEAEPLNTLPHIVVLADEFADMMMVVGKKIEQLIARIAQKARAAGIHLVLATQRPSVDVITGLIKANIPTRIAFQVSSKVDSRTVLDQSGAEQLLGHGDMLYLPPGSGVPMRVHGAFVEDDEVHRVVKDLKRRGEPEYLDDILQGGGDVSPEFAGDEASGGNDEQDALYDQAVDIVLRSRRASISSIQRRLKIGYNRAARLVETMEAAGVVSQMGSNGQREVLAPPPVDA